LANGDFIQNSYIANHRFLNEDIGNNCPQSLVNLLQKFCTNSVFNSNAYMDET